MPIYEFRCRKCQNVFEALRPMGDTGKSLKCPECGTSAPEKKLSVFAAASSSPSSGGEPACASSAGCGVGSPFG